MKGKDIEDKEYPDFEEEKINENVENNSLEAEIENDIFNGSFEFEDNVPVLEDKIESIDNFDFDMDSETTNEFTENKLEEDLSLSESSFNEATEFDSVSLDDFEFEEEKENDTELSTVSLDEENISDFDNIESDTLVEIDSFDKIEEVKDDEFNFNDEPELTANDDVVFEEFEEVSNDDFSFEENNEETIVSKNDDMVLEEFEEIVEENINIETTDFDFEDLTSTTELTNDSDDFDLTNVEEESNLNNNNYEDFKEDVMSNKEDVFESDNDDFDFDTNENDNNNKESFKFEENSTEDFEYDFGGQEKDSKYNDDFEFETVSTSSDDFNTTYNFEEEENTDTDKFDVPESEENLEEDHKPRVLKNSDNESEELDNTEKPKTKIKLILGLVVVALLAVGGVLGFNVLNNTSMEEEETENQIEEEVPTQTKKVKKEVKKPTAVDMTELEELTEEPIRKYPEKVNTPIEAPSRIESKTVDIEEYNKVNGQLERLIGNISNLSSEVSNMKEENKRLNRLVEEMKKANQGNGNLENFQLDFSNVKSEINTLKKQVATDKSFNKDTMIKFLKISKKLREEINGLKTQQVDKSALDLKFAELEKLTKDIETLNNKVSNNEVLTKLATLEKDINASKLAEVQEQVTRTNQKIENTVNKKKSVLELLEEKNKEKELESNTVVVEEEEDLRVPLSVTIEDESEYEAPVVRKQVVQKKSKHVYKFIGTIEGIVYLKNSAGSISEYRVNDQLPGYGEILKIYKDGTIETDNGPLNFK